MIFIMVKKLLIFFVSYTLLFVPATYASENPEQNQVGQAATNGAATASAIAWASLGISLLVVIGVIIAVTVSHDHKTCSCCKSK